MVLREIYNQPLPTTRPPRKVLHLDDPVPEDVYDLGSAPVRDPLLVGSVQVLVPVQPQGGLVAVYEVQERLEADVGLVLGVAEAEGRGVGDEDLRSLSPGEPATQDPHRERPGPEAHLALRVLVGAAGVETRAGEPGNHDPAGFAFYIHDPAVERGAAFGVLGGVGVGVVVAQDVVDRDAEEGDDVLQVVEGKITAGDHGLHPLRVGVEARPVEHRLHPVADAQELHVLAEHTAFRGRCAARAEGSTIGRSNETGGTEVAGPETPKLMVDVVIPAERGVVLIRRGNEPFKGRWALPGGFVEVGETVEEAADREAAEETGLAVEVARLVGVYSDPERDPRGHNVSVAFLVRVLSGELAAASDAAEVAVLDPASVELAFDHARIIQDALR